MSNDNQAEQTESNNRNLPDLSRRKLLAGVGGGVSAGTILGAGATWAFLTDQETFGNNELVAGELDLKVNWQQTYNGDPVNAFPDEDGDGMQDEIRTRQEIANDAGLPIDSPSVEKTFRDQFADVPNDTEAPVINLEDVKPGDVGAIKFNLHIFDNPGRIRMGGSVLENSENGQNEPEKNALDRFSGTEGELMEAIQAGILLDGQPHLTTTLGRALDFLSFCGVSLGAIPNSTTHSVELRWALPEATGNSVQTDSGKFDLSFFTQQLRNNTVQTVDLKIDKKVKRNMNQFRDEIPAETGDTIRFKYEVTNTNISKKKAKPRVHGDKSIPRPFIVNGSNPQGGTVVDNNPPGNVAIQKEQFTWDGFELGIEESATLILKEEIKANPQQILVRQECNSVLDQAKVCDTQNDTGEPATEIIDDNIDFARVRMAEIVSDLVIRNTAVLPSPSGNDCCEFKCRVEVENTGSNAANVKLDKSVKLRETTKLGGGFMGGPIEAVGGEIVDSVQSGSVTIGAGQTKLIPQSGTLDVQVCADEIELDNPQGEHFIIVLKIIDDTFGVCTDKKIKTVRCPNA